MNTIVNPELAAKVAPPPFVVRLSKRAATLPAPLPQLWAVRVWAHLVGSTGITAVQVGHMLFRDQLITLLTDLGADEQRLAAFRARHERFFGAVYDGLRRAHWYI
ncbi:hypothetical protein H0264_30545 [Nocardia huaxiensis]|uniref:Uncharacterized protein n=1 Tax=Nocardia huaxiensis TaxID=2755382 RepID=A0A7D6V7I3_9NOCA|nr:hypothetical protein [Nocardia huaxiensis]QLY29552.1 hypothetical protein H0264_30545 [Nocardia huaxiensis]